MMFGENAQIDDLHVSPGCQVANVRQYVNQNVPDEPESAHSAPSRTRIRLINQAVAADAPAVRANHRKSSLV
jgi:hypothetical protein